MPANGVERFRTRKASSSSSSASAPRQLSPTLGEGHAIPLSASSQEIPEARIHRRRICFSASELLDHQLCRLRAHHHSHILPNITLETSLPEGWAELPQCHFTTLPAGPPLRSVWSDCVREPAETTLQWMANTGGADMLFNGEGEAFNVKPPSSSPLRNELNGSPGRPIPRDSVAVRMGRPRYWPVYRPLGRWSCLV